MSSIFEHVTVPVDGSPTSKRGVAFALVLARGGGRITFCSVVDPTLACMPSAGGAAIDPGPMLAVLDEDAAAFCDEAVLSAAAAGIGADTRVLHGTRADQIASLVRGNGSNAVVVGTHGRSGVAKALLGSVAEALVRSSDVPVVVVHEDDVMRTGPIAVALDGSQGASAALIAALPIAKGLGTSIALVHVDERDPAKAGTPADELLRDAEACARKGGVSCSIVARSGRAAETIVAVADEIEASMIFIGTHGRPFLERLVIGSVATAVIEHARIPVVTVRRPERG